MPTSRFYDRRGRSHLTADQGQTSLAPATNKVGEIGYVVPGAENVADDASSILSQFKAVYELGNPGLAQAISADASAQEELAVPAGKYWRLIGGSLQYSASNDAASRIPIITIEDTASAVKDTLTLTTRVADFEGSDEFLFGTYTRVRGSRGVNAEGRLTIVEQVTAGDTMTIDTTVYTFVAAGTTPTAAQSPGIVMGATEALTKNAIETALFDGAHPTVNARAVFSGDNLDLFARETGLAVPTTIALTETFTASGNVFANATLGDQTEGVENAQVLGTLDFPTSGVYLIPTDKVVLNVTAGHANDAFEFNVFYIEYDNDPLA